MKMKGVVMYKKFSLFTIFLIFAIPFYAQKGQQEKKEITAYIIKIVRDVDVKAPKETWQKAVLLSQLKAGYEVRTDKKSLAVISFPDQSKLVLREKSIATIKGEIEGKRIIDRNVHLERGDIIFNVKKAETEQFRFSSPISVASIRGTQGRFITYGILDTLTILEGFAEITNSISGKIGKVLAGQSAVADSSGNVNVFETTKSSLNGIIDGQKAEIEERMETDTTEARGINFGQLKSKQPGSVSVDLSSFEGKAIQATLYCRKNLDDPYTEIGLDLIGQTAKGKIPAEKVKYPKLEYYLVVKLSDGSSIIMPENGDKNPGIAPVQPIQHVLRIPGQTGTLQKKVVVIKWNE